MIETFMRNIVGSRRRSASIAALCALALSSCASGESSPLSEGAGIAAGPAAQRARTVAPIEIKVASAAGKYLAGRYARHNRDFDAAAELFSDALGVESDNSRIRRQAFYSLTAGGRMKEAGALAREIVLDNDGAPIANLTLIVEDVVAGKDREAEARLKSMPRRGMNTFTAPLLLAWVQASQNDLVAAAASLEPLEKVSSFAALRHLHLGLIYQLAGQTAKAEEHLSAAVQSTQSLRVVQAYGRFLERQGRSRDAAAVYKEFEEKNPGSDSVDEALERVEDGREAPLFVGSHRDGMAEVFFNLAGTLAQGRSSELALIYGRLALRLRPDFPLAQLLLGGLLESLDRGQDAAVLYRTVNPKSPLHWSAQLRLASVLDDLDRHDEAIALLRKMAEQDTARHEPLIRLGDMLRSEERFEDASVAYSQALERVGTLSKDDWSILYARGITYERSKRWEPAEKDFLRALELSPDQPFVLNYLGYSWVDKGMHLDRARKMIEKAVELRPNDGYIVDSLGWVLYRLGDYRGAVEHLERAVVLRPEDPTINDHLGDAYWRVGRLLEARFQWKRALSLDPEKEQVPLIRDKLNQGLAEATPTGRRG